MDQKYRLYIDESGTHNYSQSDEIKERYLCLNGIIISAKHNQEFIAPKWEELRKFFTEDHDFPAIFHLTDIKEKIGVFKKLENEEVQQYFNEKYLEILANADFTLCCVVLDKKNHIEKYGDTAMHPYPYCLNVLVERYVKFLQVCNAIGDVVTEVRGMKEDRKLRSEFEHFYETGTHFLTPAVVQARLSSKQIKIKTKEARISGIELADMLATPMKFLTLYEYKIIPELSDNFTKSVLDQIYSKIRKNPYKQETIKGFGIKLI